VGFRWTAERIADSLSLTGWAMNGPDGSVEIICEGKESDIQIFMEKIKEAMGLNIEAVKVTWQKSMEEFKSFTIKF
ncbi:MAG: hypothetical protein A2Y81_08705, partial [Nitrospirae bacterium RBG_13_43_8]